MKDCVNMLKKRLQEFRNQETNPANIKDIAKNIGINYQTLYKYYNGIAECSIGNLCKISKYYNVSTDYLLGITENQAIDVEMKYIGNVTTLTEKAVNNLNKAVNKTVASNLIENENFVKILDCIATIEECEQLISVLESMPVNQHLLAEKVEKCPILSKRIHISSDADLPEQNIEYLLKYLQGERNICEANIYFVINEILKVLKASD